MAFTETNARCTLIPLIKFCGLTSERDIEAAAQAGADAAGVVLSDGPCRVDDVEAALLATHARDLGLVSVGVAGRADARGARRALGLGFDLIQVLCPTRSDYDVPVLPSFPDAADVGVRIESWRQTRLLSGTELVRAEFVGRAWAWLDLVQIDGAGGGGKGVAADWSRAARLAARWPLMLAGGLTPGNVGEAVARVRPQAVDVSSGIEASHARKDPNKMRAFVQAIRALTSKPD